MTRVYALKNVKKKNAAGEETEESEQKWIEQGKGELHLNMYKANEKMKGRAILRAEKTQRLVLNAPIFDQMKVELSGEKVCQILLIRFRDETGQHLIEISDKK